MLRKTIRSTPSAKRFAAAAGFALALAAMNGAHPARADFDSGFAAYLAGDPAGAFQTWLPLAEQGHADAQFGIGMLYENGEGLPPDQTAAAKWYQKAAAQDHALAQVALASMYERGRGVAQNFQSALAWYRRAADLGNAQAQFNLGRVYEYGLGVADDIEQALAWYRAAAEQGYARGLAKLAELRERGIAASSAPAAAADPAADDAAPAPEAGTAAASVEERLPASAPPEASLEPANAVRFSSYFDRDSALLGWRDLIARHGELLNGLEPAVVEVESGAPGVVFYRLMAVSLDAAAAARLCAELGARGVSCEPARLSN